MRVLTFLLALTAAAQTWKPAAVTLKTTWGEKVTPTNAWREYPRPQFVRERWENLNGLWDYAVTPKTAAMPSRFDGQILVPTAWKGDRVLLHFGAVDYECALWVNGGYVGGHSGGFDAFTFDITSFLRDGLNEILVGVTDPSDTGEQPRGKQVLKPQGIWYTAVSGIWQTVWIEPVPSQLHLSELRLTPDLEAGGLRVAALVNEPVIDETYAVRLTSSAGGKQVSAVTMRVNREGFVPVPNARLWSPDDPFLYDLKGELVRVKNPFPTDRLQRIPQFGTQERDLYSKAEVQGAALDTVGSYFGMRKVAIGPGKVAGQPAMLLNGT